MAQLDQIDDRDKQISDVAEKWRRTELPTERSRILAAGFCSYEAMRDEIFTPDELSALGWAQDICCRNWYAPGLENNPLTALPEKRDLKAEYEAMMDREPRAMPDDFRPEIVEENGMIVCRHIYDGKWTINMGFFPSGDPFLDCTYREALRRSVWGACETFRLGRGEELEALGMKPNADDHGVDTESVAREQTDGKALDAGCGETHAQGRAPSGARSA